jgi:GT2 family glycosyltransferase
MSRPIDVIIVNYNTRTDLLACLTSLHTAWPETVERIVVVDNGSRDGSVAAIRSAFPAVSLIALDQNRGFGAANNAALRASTAEFVLFLNSDTIVPPGAIEGLHARAIARRAVAAGPKLLDETGRPEISFGRMLSPWSELIQQTRQRVAANTGGWARRYVDRLVADERSVDWVSGACLLAHRESTMAVGGFDERFFLYEEDVDLCAALRARGGTILFTPATQVVHLRGRSVSRTDRPAGAPSHYDTSHLAFYEKHAPFWAPWLRRWLRLRGRSIG